jgi:hypothetical protein
LSEYIPKSSFVYSDIFLPNKETSSSCKEPILKLIFSNVWLVLGLNKS